MSLDSYKNQLQRWENLILGLQLAKHASIGYIRKTMTAFVKQLEQETEPGHVLSFIQHQVNPSNGCAVQYCEHCGMIRHFIRKKLNEGRSEIICMETREELTDDDLWWAICKIFINYSDIKDSVGPEDVSSEVIVVLMLNCKLFGKRTKSSEHSDIEASMEPEDFMQDCKLFEIASVSELAERLNTLRKKIVHCLEKSLSDKDMEIGYRTIYDFIMATYDESTSPEALDELQKLKSRGVHEIRDGLLERALTNKKEELENKILEGQTTGNSVAEQKAMLGQINKTINMLKVGDLEDATKDEVTGTAVGSVSDLRGNIAGGTAGRVVSGIRRLFRR